MAVNRRYGDEVGPEPRFSKRWMTALEIVITLTERFWCSAIARVASPIEEGSNPKLLRSSGRITEKPEPLETTLQFRQKSSTERT